MAKQKILIKKNQSLTIQKQLIIPNDGVIILEKNSQLIIDNGKVYCPNIGWNGVENRSSKFKIFKKWCKNQKKDNIIFEIMELLLLINFKFRFSFSSSSTPNFFKNLFSLEESFFLNLSFILFISNLIYLLNTSIFLPFYFESFLFLFFYDSFSFNYFLYNLFFRIYFLSFILISSLSNSYFNWSTGPEILKNNCLPLVWFSTTIYDEFWFFL